MTENLFHLNDKTILVCGATSGIGQATTELAASMGAKLYLTGRRIPELDQLGKKIGQNCLDTITADLTDTGEIKNLCSAIGNIDGLVYSPGILEFIPIKYLHRDNYQKVFNINYFAAVELSHHLVKSRLLKNEASLVFISSIASQFPFFGGSAYGGSKAALENFSHTLAMELKGKRIRSNCLLPASIKTNMHDQVDEKLIPRVSEEYETKYALGFGTPSDVAHGATFLLSDAARWITGQKLILDGGLMLSR